MSWPDTGAGHDRSSVTEAAAASCQILGILNVTPDSFSDGGRNLDVDVAVGRAHQMVEDGADVIDVGGESTRPGARRTPVEIELGRVLPFVRRLVADGVVVAVDTMRARVARAAIDAGAQLVNDVSGGAADPAMLPLLAETGLRCVLMHWRGHSDAMSANANYVDVLSDVAVELERCVDRAVATGIATERIIVDPGLGFAKNSHHDWEILQGLHQLRTRLQLPILVGASRKRFLTEMVGGAAASMQDRDAATASVSALVAAVGCWGVRVHDVHASSIAIHVGRRMFPSAQGAATLP